MKLHQLLFGGSLVLCVVFISRVLVQQNHEGVPTKRPSASSANLERSIASLVQQQRCATLVHAPYARQVAYRAQRAREHNLLPSPTLTLSGTM